MLHGRSVLRDLGGPRNITTLTGSECTYSSFHPAPLLLLQLQLPSGDSLAAKVTMHAGKYAGAVVGRSAWTYE